MADFRLLENGTDKRLLENGTDLRILEHGAYAALILTLSPVAWWRLGEASGTAAVAAQGLNGTYVASPTLGVAGPLSGDTNTAVTLNGSTQYVTVPDVAVLDQGNGPYSWTCWVKRSAVGVRAVLISKGSGAPQLEITSDNKVHLYIRGVALAINSTTTISDTTTWHFIAATRTGTTWKMYIDGVDVSDTPGAGGTSVNTTDALNIGRDVLTSDGHHSGAIDEVALFGSALTATNISDLYAAATSAGTTVTPTTASLTLATFAPTVSTPRLAVPTTASLTLTAFAPTVSTPRLAVPTTATLVTASFAPTVTATANVTVTPGVATLVTAGFAPTVTASDNQSVTPTTTALSLATFEPTVSASDNQAVVPGVVALTLTTFAPTVGVPDNQTVTPNVASLSLATFAPSIELSDHQVVTPDAVALVLSAFEPTLTASDHQSVTPTTAALILSSSEPTVTATAHQTAAPVVASLVLTPFAPTVTGGAGLTVTAGVAALSLASFAPDVLLTDNQLVTPAAASLTLSTFAATVTGSGVVVPPTGGGGFQLRRPRRVMSNLPDRLPPKVPVRVTAGAASLTLTTYSPTVEIVEDETTMLLLLSIL